MNTDNTKRRFYYTRILFSVIILGVILLASIYIIIQKGSDALKQDPNFVAYHAGTQAEDQPVIVKETIAPSPSDTPKPTATPLPTIVPTPSSAVTPVPQRQEPLPPVGSVEEHFKAIFKDSVFIGDSISEGLSYFEYVEEANVVARRGLNLYSVRDELGNAAAVKPKNVFILFGANDMVGGDSCEAFINAYKGLLDEIRQKIPNSRIYIQSILPVTTATGESNSALSQARIDEFNTALIRLAKEENISFINIASVLSPYGESLHEGDGIHFKPPFYPLWLDFVEKAVR